VASRRFLGMVADRANLYVFPPSYAGKLWPPERRAQAYLLDLTNDGTWEALAGRQSPLRAGRPYTVWVAGSDAMMLLDRTPEPARAVDRDLSGMRLRGLEVRQDGASVEIEAHWQAPVKPPVRLSRVVSILDGQGQVLAENKGLAIDDLLPTEQWPAGQEIVDRVRLDAPADRRAQVRLQWIDQAGAGDAFEAGLGDSR
jgi:hypothetical protein